MDAGIDYRVVESSPWLLRLAYVMQRKGIRGGYYLENTARSKGWLDVLVRTTLPGGVKIDIPAYKDAYDLSRIDQYERDLMQLLATRLGGQKSPLVLLDCGADLGLFSALLVSSCNRIRKVIAFEPNRGSFSLLKHNLEMLPVPAEAKNAAVADFNGRGELSYPPHDAHDHAAFIVPAEDGTIPVTRLGRAFGDTGGAWDTLILSGIHRGVRSPSGSGEADRHRPDGDCLAAHRAQVLPFFEQYPGRIYNICVFSE